MGISKIFALLLVPLCMITTTSQQDSPTSGGKQFLDSPIKPEVYQTGFSPGSSFGQQQVVAFTVARASRVTMQAPTQIMFENRVTDQGYGWNQIRGLFICYYPGIYFFTFSGMSPNRAHFRVDLIRNNHPVVSAWGNAEGYQVASNSAVLILQKNDQVYLKLAEGYLYEGSDLRRGYTTFSGFKIF